MLDGQLCYYLDVTNEANSKIGKDNGLIMLLDFGPTESAVIQKIQAQDYDGQTISLQTPDKEKEEIHPKVFVKTLSRDISYGAGSFALSALQKIIGKNNFLAFPEDIKHCQDESFEKCQSKEFFNKVLEMCECVPWGLNSLKGGYSEVMYRVSKKSRVMCLWVHKFKASHILCFLQCALVG